MVAPLQSIAALPPMIRGTAAGANCSECPFARMGNPCDPVMSIGPADPAWIIVGEGPGQNETRLSVPFVGQSGVMVNDVLTQIGVQRHQIMITNSTLCQPPGGSSDADKKKARNACAPRLKAELAQYPGKPILALGAIAAQGFCGDKFSITQMAGSYHEIDVDGTGILRDVIPSIHPAAILRGGTGGGGGGGHTTDLAFWNLIYDALKVKLLAEGRDIKFTDDGFVEAHDPVRAEKIVEDFLKHARKIKVVACDTETFVDDPKRHSALQARYAKLNAIGLATVEYGICIAWRVLTPRAKRFIGAILGDPTIVCTFHNGLYDIPVLQRHGFEVNGRVEDTMLQHHNAFPGLAHGLQRVGTQFFALRPWKSEYRHGEGSIDELVTYCRRDTLVTARVQAPLTIMIKRTAAERTYEIDLQMAKAAAQMHVNGVPISREVNDHLRNGFKKNIDEAKSLLIAKAFEPAVYTRMLERLAFEQARRIRKHDSLDLNTRIDARLEALNAKPFDLKIDAGDHVVAFLKACGVPLSLQTGTGKISTKKDILEAFIHHPEVRSVITYRENVKLLSTFIERMFDRTYASGKFAPGFADENDRIHPRWSIHKISGRWGAEAPSQQNIPKADKKKGRPNLRSQVVAPHGRNLVAFDACLAKGTLIDTPYGDQPIETIKAGDLVYSFNFETMRPACSKVVRRASTGNRKTLKVTLDNGKAVRCTPDHRWYVKPRGIGAGAVEMLAEDLRVGMRLLPLRRGVISNHGNVGGYESLYSYSAFQYVATHRIVARAVYGSQPEGYDAHHKNEDKRDNRPENLEYKLKSDHLREHSAINTKEQWKDPVVRKKMCKGISDAVAARGGFGGANNPRFGERSGQFGNCPTCGTETYFGGKHPKRFCSRTCYAAFRASHKGFPKGTKWYDLNHKIIAIDYDDLIVPTFDIEVENDHNFALSAGVFVHNSQLEARLIALKSGDPFLVGIFKNGKDIHNEFARLVWPDFDKRLPDERKVLRDLVKRPEYCSFYGGAVETAWKAVVRDYPNVTITQIGQMVALMRINMPGVAAWQQGEMRVAERDGEVRSMILGRRRAFPIKQFDLSEVINFGIQSSGADLINIGLAEIMPKLPLTAFPILQIHDAVVFEVAEDDTDLVKQLVIDCFTRDVTYEGRTMNFPVDAKSGKSWDIVN